MAVFEVECPCCRADLTIDPVSRTILSHEPAEPETRPTDLFAEVERIKKSEGTRDARFARQLDAQRRQEEAMENRFDDLLKKAGKSGPVRPGLRDIDLD